MLQDDILYESLTVAETLGFAAQLRLPREWSRAQKAARADAGARARARSKYELQRCHDERAQQDLIHLPKPESKTTPPAPAVMEQLGLGGSRGTIIGGFFRRGISGARPARWVMNRGGLCRLRA